MQMNFNLNMTMTRYKDELYPVRSISDLKDLINQSAALYPNRDAFLVKHTPGGLYQSVNYEKLKQDMDALGTALMNLGLTGKKIAVIGENRYEWVIAYLATINGVGTIVPLDKELPVAEIHHLLQFSGVSAVIYSGKVEIAIEEAVQGIPAIEYLISMDADIDRENYKSLNLLIEKGKKLIAEEKRYYLDAIIDPEVLAIILFTSGTTGLAKGVMLNHKNLCANVVGVSRFIKLTGEDTTLSVLPIHHTYEFTGEILTCLYQGACIAFCEGLKYIVKNMAESRATILLGVPLIFESMHKKVWKKAESSGSAEKLKGAIAISRTLNKFNIKAARRLFKSIHAALGGNARMFIVGAAATDPTVIEDFNAMGITMFQGYGLTECSPLVSVNKDRYFKAASVGLPLQGTEIQIIDKDENGVGEIICRSDSVMLGYYNNPEETAKVLKDGWLYTGDYGYFDRDGFLYISGRKKNVIITKNGKNIFPEEVEFYLNKSDYISEVVVWGLDDAATGETIVCAEVVPDFETIKDEMGELSPEKLTKLMGEIIDAANEKMSTYKRVKRFNIRETEFEKTTTKKIKRHTALNR
jgi:long-chain acyl-CoA synthetase